MTLKTPSKDTTMIADSVTKPVPPPTSCKLLGSVRLTYTICAFLAMLLNTWLRNTMNFVVLCMSHGNQIPKMNEEIFRNASQTTSEACGSITEETQTANSTMQEPGDLDWSRSEQFLMLSSIYIGSLLIAPFAGHWSDKYGGKICFVNGIVLQAIVFMASPLMIRWHYVAGFIMRILQGVLAGLSSPAVYILFSVWSHPTERTALMSFAYGGFSVGSILAYPISGQLCQFGWENTFYAVGMIVLLISVPFYWLVYSSLDEHPRIGPQEYAYLHSGNVESKHPKVPWRHLLTSVPVYSFTLTHVLHSYIITVITLTLPKMLKDTMSFSLTEISFYSMFPFLGCVLSKAVTLTLISRIEHHFKLQLTKFRRILYVLTNTAINVCVCSLIWLNCEQREIVVFIYLAVGFFSDVGFSGAYWPSMLYVAPLFAGLIAGIANCFSTLTGVITPVITAAVVKNGTREEWNFILYSILFANSLALLIYGCWGSSDLQPWGKVAVKSEETRKSSLKKGEASNENRKVSFVNECFDTKL